ncbi:MAG: M20/M25/M40 family metallo-hydrolase, partial [Gillisia sp.]
GLGNANKFMNRLLFDASENLDMQIAWISGGGLRNAIPRESEAVVTVDDLQKKALISEIKKISEEISNEYASLEPRLNIEISETQVPKDVMSGEDKEYLLKTLAAAHNGVYRMSPDIEGLVETSNNIAKVEVKEGQAEIRSLTRSSVDSSKEDLVRNLTSCFELGNFQVKLSGDYPGWTPDRDSSILKVLDDLYQTLNGEKAEIAACHAGLECGIIGAHYPEMDMISFGPTIRGAHSPDERASISSTQKYWKFVLEILKNIPEK